MVNNKNTQSFLNSKQCQGQDTGIKQKGKKSIIFWVWDGEYYTSVVPSFKNLKKKNVCQHQYCSLFCHGVLLTQ